jgi:hypothetical protein
MHVRSISGSGFKPNGGNAQAAPVHPPAPPLGPPLPHLHLDLAHARTSLPGLRSPLSTSSPGLGAPRPLHAAAQTRLRTSSSGADGLRLRGALLRADLPRDLRRQSAGRPLRRPRTAAGRPRPSCSCGRAVGVAGNAGLCGMLRFCCVHVTRRTLHAARRTPVPCRLHCTLRCVWVGTRSAVVFGVIWQASRAHQRNNQTNKQQTCPRFKLAAPTWHLAATLGRSRLAAEGLGPSPRSSNSHLPWRPLILLDPRAVTLLGIASPETSETSAGSFHVVVRRVIARGLPSAALAPRGESRQPRLALAAAAAAAVRGAPLW